MAKMLEIVGIVNLTRDSFSDGGLYLAPDRAVAHARALAAAGADVVELGPASSHPDAESVAASDQIARLAPVLEALAPLGMRISIDATEGEVVRFALREGVALVNDVRGFPDPALYPALAASSARLVVVHSLSGADRARREAASPRVVLDSIERFFDARLAALVRAGVEEARLVVDPGMGFFLGNDPRASLAVLQRLPDLRARFGRPVLISVSRKSFLRALCGSPIETIGAATLAAELFAARSGVDFVRTHDVRALVDALTIERSLASGLVD